MRYHILIDGHVQDSSNELDEAREIFSSLRDTASDNNYPVRIILKDMASFEEIDCF